MKAPLRILVIAVALLGLFVAPADARNLKMGTLSGHVHIDNWPSWPPAAGPVILTDCATGYTATVMPTGDTFHVIWPRGTGSVSIRAAYTLSNVRAIKVIQRRSPSVDFGALTTGDLDRNNVIDWFDLELWNFYHYRPDLRPDLNYDGLRDYADVNVISRNLGKAGQSCPDQ